jgi:catechol 2,3-dioxygenase-like lactoylglutathione lyase family enzyme
MSIRLGHVTILVRDYDEALKFYTELLGFEKRNDQKIGPVARWLTVAAPGQDVQIVLQKPEPAIHGEEGTRKMTERIGQSPTWVLATDDCRKTYELYSSRGVRFTEAPKEQVWGGIQAVFKDLYGNSYALVQLHSAAKAGG